MNSFKYLQWAVAFFVLSFIDGVLTYIDFCYPYGGNEVNPVYRASMEAMGVVPSMFVVKLPATLGVIAGATYLGRKWVWWVLVGLMVGVVVNNIIVLVV